ncbi:ABC transporter permease [Sediminispirochaeta smaragdinae]|uniref:Binding-protein-dependent transport systems inner membrane component n=1 Tax=Sediminispirochaeta smaragdinae (strain DSM 11293 / JCM 15392 / SEBR 4228) TaxID=573413 RepID=E1R7X4_SEDSS|nr:ABC transporter permease [Sediminispirochaeta smaragdinae]ADK82829.1 binding-protein-dependent transport systems inner membrane component [Sediminispirochaeta smaragdinae DSM 11293]
MSLVNYIIRRLFFMIFVLLGVSILVFSVMMLLPPGMRAAAYVTNEKISPDQFENIIRTYGLDDPAPVQYFRWMGNVLKGDFGYSATAEAPVLSAFKSYFPVTFELVLYATPLIILFGIWLGTLGAIHKDTPIDHGSRIFAIIGYSLPTFWLGLILLMLFYGLLGIFPPGTLSNEGKDLLYSQGFHHYTSLITIDAILNGRWGLFKDALMHLLLPIINLVILSSALIMRLMRSNMLEQLGQDYIRTALAKGADRRTINYKHARRNALLPVITVSGVMFANLMGGMVITETIFSRKGLGWWMARAATQLDVSAVMFNVLFLGMVFVTVNLIVDIIYAAIDPRIRLG